MAEAEFLNLVIVHFQTGWWIARAGGITALKEMKADIWSFFTLPLPRAVWEDTSFGAGLGRRQAYCRCPRR